MTLLRSLTLLSSLSIYAVPTLAAQPHVSFTHGEWEIYCTNTGTCRAAGYQLDEGDHVPASMLLTRQAGANQIVNADIVLSIHHEDMLEEYLKNIHFYLNGKDLGKVNFLNDDVVLMGKLNPSQVQALLKNPQQANQIVFKNSKYIWQISDKGMTAVLLKMDDFQQRIGTTGALVRKGKLSEHKVLAAQPKLQVKKIVIPESAFKVVQPDQPEYALLAKKLAASLQKDGMCEGDFTANSDKNQKESISLYKLNDQQVLATSLCWRAAYNEGYGAWVINKNFSGTATFISDSVSGIASGQLYSWQKGRGIGDCIASSVWTWNGKAFILTEDRWSGMCKGLTIGGVWSLDLIEAQIK